MPEGSPVYLDSCCFIDLVKQKLGIPLTTDREQDVWFIKNLLQANRDREMEVFTSTLAIAECTHIDGNVSQKIKDEFSTLLMSGQYVRLVQPTPFIVQAARDLRWGHGLVLKGADAIHVASALDRKCAEFVTTDHQVTKLNGNAAIAAMIKAVPGRLTTCLPQKYRQEDMKLDEGDK